MTPFDPLTLYLDVETATLNTIRADAWLSDAANVTTIRRKPLRALDGTPTYLDAETPVVAVYCTGQGGENTDTLSENEIVLDVVVDVVASGGDGDTIDDQVKIIMGHVRSLLRIQHFTGDFEAATELDGFAAGGEIQLGEARFALYVDDAGWVAEGVTRFTVKLFSQE